MKVASSNAQRHNHNCNDHARVAKNRPRNDGRFAHLRALFFEKSAQKTTFFIARFKRN